MRKIKILFGLLIVTCVFSLLGVNASSYASFIGIDIPAFNGNYTSGYYTKTEYGNQYFKKTSAIDQLSGDERAIQARLKDTAESWVTAPKGQVVQLDSSNYGSGLGTGSYRINIRASKSTVSKAWFNGYWYLDASAV